MSKVKEMSKVTVYNLEGKKVEDIELNQDIFGVEINEDLVYQVLRVQNANAREVYAHTKGRSDVQGGGRKPWKQKGTGRARAGTSRSPLWIGGGVTFGPTKDRNFSLRINKKMKKKALLMTLTDKVIEEHLIIVDSLALGEAKTKSLAVVLKNLKIDDSSVLIAVSSKNKNLQRAAGNIQKVETLREDSLNVGDVLKYKYLVLEKDSLPVIEKTYNA